jgi:hypothetical protein
MSPRSLTNNKGVSILISLRKQLVSQGFDICHLFHPAWYNQHIAKENLSVSQLPISKDSSSTVGLLIGNTKRLWPRFLEWYHDDDHVVEQDDKKKNHPFDTFVEDKISTVTKLSIPNNHPVQYRWSHDIEPDRLVAMARLASCTGLTYLDPVSHLSIHPEYGPWHSFRAVLLIHGLDIDHAGLALDPNNPPHLQPRLLTQDEEENAKQAMKHAMELVSNDDMQLSLLNDTFATKQREQAEAWIAVRDCISRGKDEYRFDEQQLWYHYTKDPKYLK